MPFVKTKVIRARVDGDFHDEVAAFCAEFKTDISDTVRAAVSKHMAEERQRAEISRMAMAIHDAERLNPKLAEEMRKKAATLIQKRGFPKRLKGS